MQCQSCGEPIPDKSRYCTYCGSNIASEITSGTNINIKGRDVTVGGDIVGRDKFVINITPEINFLHQIWDSLAPELQDALSLAYNQSLREGTNVIKTHYFFAALLRLQPEPLPSLLGHLPKGSLPKPIDTNLSGERTILRGDPHLSACIQSSLQHLSVRATPQDKLSSADIFIDIAKHGTGKSVARLRTHGVTPEEIDQLIKQLGWQII